MKVSKMFKVKADEDSNVIKTCTLELTVPDGTTIEDLARAVLASEVIKAQARARKEFDKIESGHVYQKTFQKPGIDVDPEMAMLELLRNMTPEQQQAKFAELMAKVAPAPTTTPEPKTDKTKK
jgi:hypothetical protein